MFKFLGELLSIFLTVALLYSVLHAVVTHLIYWMESRLAYWQDPSQSRPSALLLVRNAAIEIVCNFSRFLLLPFSAFQTNPNPIAAEAAVMPILLVHGYGQNQSDWFWFQYQLKQAGVGPVYTLNLWNMMSGIEAHADKLAKKIQAIHEKHPNEGITLIGHSMGGLVCSYYAEYLRKEDINIKKIITIGSPLYGTRMASLGAGLSVEQMAPNAPFLEALRLKMDKSNISYYHIASQMDNTIVPWESALKDPLKPDAPNQHVIPDQGHLRLLISPQVLEKTKNWLT
jgi:pimeloyl-ACP methyl ester carboxylesterase